ncbi:MAG: sigma-70 family RNA polymerase sigma factor [Verrucomicrobiales bacterium]
MTNQTEHHQAFPPTQWSVILSASDDDSEIRSQALEHICQCYWHPIYAYARKRGFSPQDAEDITQDFFGTLLETKGLEQAEAQRGKLRTYLLVRLRNFMANEWRRRKTKKRGGGAAVLSLDLDEAEQRTCLEPADHLTPEAVFERHWATTLLNTVMQRLQEAFEADGKGENFRVLKDYIARGDHDRKYLEVSEQMGISENAVRLAIHRLRKRYRDLLLQEIELTLEPGESAEAELRYLFGVFQS